jgi:PhnB protein
MAKFHPYLNFAGNTEEAFNFYKSVFGGEFGMIMRFGEMQEQPGCESPSELSDEDKTKIMHIALPIGDGRMLMATDSLESMGQKLVVGNNNYIYLECENRGEADRLFNGISAGGTIEMPMGDTFWGAYFGCFADKFGVKWMVSYDQSQAQ